MRPVQPVYTAHLFPALHGHLLELLRSLNAADWQRPTVCLGWTVQDVASHILDTQIRLLRLRDNLAPVQAFDGKSSETEEGYQELVGFLNRTNAAWVEAARRMGPRLLMEFLSITGPLLAEQVTALDPAAPAPFAVAWAGDDVSPNWFDIGRSYTEYWHHQQQIRDAVGAIPLSLREWLHPVLAIFMRAVPHTYRDVPASDGDAVNFTISGEAGADWSILHQQNRWHLFDDLAPNHTAALTISSDAAWRLFTKGLTGEQARGMAQLTGRSDLAGVFFRTLSVMA
jgi:uncharacterized protein (TIGR03083 family)